MRRRSLAPLLMAGLAAAAPAQLPDPALIVRERAALAVAKRQSASIAADAAAIERQAAAARTAADRLRDERLGVLARIRSAEADVAAADARIVLVDALRRRQRAVLAGQQGGIVRLTAALQMMARRPAALALVQPSSLADLVRVRVLLASALPIVARRTAGVRAELVAAERLGIQAGEAATALRASRYRLGRRQLELARLEAGRRAQSATLDTSAQDQAERALALGERARDIVDEMEEQGSAEDVAGRLASLPDPAERPPAPGDAPPPPPDAGSPRYLLPVGGGVADGYGGVSDAGVRARGITFAGAPGAEVVAPAAGRVLYAARYRGYGFIVIVDHGGGWSTTLTGLGDIAVAAGDHVAKGERIGTAPEARPRVTVELRRDGRPIDLAAILGVG